MRSKGAHLSPCLYLTGIQQVASDPNVDKKRQKQFARKKNKK